jgi:hypothetical protein
VTTKSREVMRDQFSVLLSAALVGSGKPVTAVYNYFKGRLDGESPVVLVTSGPIAREIAGQGTAQFAMKVGLNVIVFVAEANADAGITELEVDDLVDSIEAKIADVVAANQSAAGYWDNLKYSGQPSEPVAGKDLDGHPYVVEYIRVEADIYD